MEIKNKIKYVLIFVIGVIIGGTIAWYSAPQRKVSVPIPRSWISQSDEDFFMRYDSLKMRILYNDDAKAYSELQKMSLDTAFTIRSYDILYYALLMAEKHNNGSACYDIYRILIGPRMDGDSLVDSHDLDIDEFRRIGLHYLNLGEQLGNYNCASTIYKLLQNKTIDSGGWKPITYYEKRVNELRE